MPRAPRILLVDDEVSIQRAVAPLLRSRGYDVDVGGTGADAVKAGLDGAADLVVLDLGLPDLDGPEVCRRLRQDRRRRRHPVGAQLGDATRSRRSTSARTTTSPSRSPGRAARADPRGAPPRLLEAEARRPRR